MFNSLSPKLRDTIFELGYSKPTVIQEKVISEILKNPSENILVTAPTGYGKTEAVVFPIINHLLDRNNEGELIKVLYITPLRALNRDIFIRMFPLLSKRLKIKIEVRHGDTTSSVRARQSRKPPDVLVTTPETLQSILTGKRIREKLRGVKWVIIDEVHALVDSKRGSQLTIALERLKKLSGNFAIIGLSATIGNKEEVLDYITAGKGGKIISVEEQKDYNVIVDFVEPKLSISGRSASPFLKVDMVGIAKKIVRYVNSVKGKVLIFTNTRDTAEFLGLILRKIAPFSVAVHHSSLSREVRLAVERGFKDGDIKCVIATSSLELGIDIGEADLVIQVMSPRRVETALQRIGRSGHKVSRVSKGIILAGTVDDLFEALVIASLIDKGVIEPIDIVDMNYDVIAHQVVGMIRESYLEGKRYLDDLELFDVIKRAYPYHKLSLSKFREILEFMDRACRVIVYDNGKVKLRKRSIKYYFGNLSTIPSTLKYRVVDLSENFKKIGELDSKYVLELNRGHVFLLAGMPREVIEIDSRKREVLVISSGLEGKPPAWVGELLPVSYEVAQEVGRIREMFHDEKVVERYKKYLTDDALRSIKKAKMLYDHRKPPLSPENIVIEYDENEGTIVFHSPFGNKVNKTLATIFSLLYMDNVNLPYINFDSDAYRIIMRSSKSFALSSEYIFDEIEKIINMAIDTSLNEKSLEKLLSEAIIEFNINELAWYFINVMRRFGLLREDVDLSRRQILKLISKYRGKIVLEEAIREYMQAKMDVKKTRDILRRIDEGKIKIWFTEGVSPLALQNNLLINLAIKDVDYIVEKKYEERLLNREVRYICLSCGYEKIDKVKNFFIRCPKCGSDRISVLKRWDEDYKIVKKRLNGESLTREEIEKWKQMLSFSQFINVYGVNAILPIAATGVGLKQAIEILKGNVDSKSSLINAIRKREINYYKSRSIIESKYI